MTHVKTCPRCSGSGKMPFVVDGGVCYKCKGEGVVGGTPEEVASHKFERETKGALGEALRAFRKVLDVTEFDLYAIDLYRGFPRKAERVIGCPAKAANCFEAPFLYHFTYTQTCENPSAETLKNRELLSGHFMQIEKVAEGAVKIAFK